MTRRIPLLGLGGGVLSTLAMDLAYLVLFSKVLGLRGGIPPQAMGRWFGYLLRGRFLHADIMAAPPLTAELPRALVGHYLIRLTLGITFFVATRRWGSGAGSVPRWCSGRSPTCCRG